MRTVNTAAAALLARIAAGEQIPVVQLLEVRLDPVLYLCTAGAPLVWGGHTWSPTGLRLEPVHHAATGEVDQLAFVLPGISEEQIAMALQPVEGTIVRVYDALVDPDTGAVADAPLAWVGALDVPSLEDGSSASVQWTAEHRAVQALRVKPSLYTDDEQRRLYPGDTSLDFDPATDAAPLAWPAASYFKQ